MSGRAGAAQDVAPSPKARATARGRTPPCACLGDSSDGGISTDGGSSGEDSPSAATTTTAGDRTRSLGRAAVPAVSHVQRAGYEAVETSPRV